MEILIFDAAQLHSTKPELRFCTGSNPAHSVSEIFSGEDLWQWSQLEIRLNVFCWSTIQKKQNNSISPYKFMLQHFSEGCLFGKNLWRKIKKSDKKAMQPKSVQITWAHELPKTHKHYSYQNLGLLFMYQVHPIVSYLIIYQTYLFHYQKKSMLFKIPFLQPKRWEKYLKNYLKKVTDLSRLT